MPERSGYAAGMPSWSDVVVADLDAGKAFYGGLFGWEFQTGPPEYGSYTMCLVGGRRAAGMVAADPQVPQPLMWNVYLTSDDVDVTAATARAEGGTIVAGPRDVADQGRMLCVTDPTGAAVGFWQPRQLTGAELVGEAGAMCWHELVAKEPLIADHFYKALFPYDVEPLGEGAGEEVAVYRIGGTAAAGRTRMNNEWPGDTTSHWVTYFGVSDADAASERIGELGGRVHYGPVDSPYGRFATCVDPSGARFSIITPTSSTTS